MAPQLTDNAVERIMGGELVEKPVVQVLGQKKIAGSGGQSADRYRLLLSDGVHSHSSAMLATQLNEKVESGEMSQFCIMRLDKYICNPIQPDRRVLIILEVCILASGSEIGAKIGNPQNFKPTAAGGGGGQQAPAAAAAAAAPSAQPLRQQNNTVNQSSSSFYKNGGAPAQRAVQQNRSMAQTTPRTPGGTTAKVHPIASLTPYQNRWTVRARVTNKTGIRTWSNSRGEGKLFSVNLLDESAEIKATAFRDEVDKHYDNLELNKVYYISKAQLKTADKRYSTIENDYEMTFNSETTVVLCTDDVDLPSLSFNFIGIDQLESQQPQANVDVIGVVKEIDEVRKIIGKASNKEISKRDLTIVDESKVQVRLTIWGSDADSFDGSNFPVLAAKGCKVSDWGGRTLSALTSSQLVVNPDIPEAHRLRGWYDSVGHSVTYEAYRSEGGPGGGGGSNSNWKTFSQVKGEGLGQGDKPDYFTAKATVVFLRKENCMYMACPTADCNKKVIDQANGTFRCEKCQKEYTDFKWRMILSVNLADFSDNQWVTCFQDTAETILGKPAAEVGTMRQENEAAFDQMFQDASFKSFIFRCRAKMETYNDESRLKTVCVQATPVDFRDYNKRLQDEIDRMLQA